jgi:hypothetical protein
MFVSDVIINGVPHKAVGQDFDTVREALRSLPLRKWDQERQAWVIEHALAETNRMLESASVTVYPVEGYQEHLDQRFREARVWCQEHMEKIQERIASLQERIGRYSARSTSANKRELQQEITGIRLAMNGLLKEKQREDEKIAIVKVREDLA